MNQPEHLDQVKTVAEFDNGYWYAKDLKQFAKKLGISHASRLRKDQLEKAIKAYLDTGNVIEEHKSSATKTAKADYLRLDATIQHYVSNKQTKSFILQEALKLCPDLPKKSGV